MISGNQSDLDAATAYRVMIETDTDGVSSFSGDGGRRSYINPWTYGDAFPDPWTGSTEDGSQELQSTYSTTSVATVADSIATIAEGNLI